MYRKLSDADIREILQLKKNHTLLVASGNRDTKRHNAGAIAEQYGINRSTIYNVSNKIYPHYKEVLDHAL